MKSYVKFFVTGTAVLLVAGMVSAVILDPSIPAEKALGKHRKDVNKQIAKYISCVTKALIGCEQKGTSSAPECDLDAPASSTIADAKAKQKFIDKMAKCESKLDFTKKGPASDYSLVGCPGDSDPVTSGDQPYADYDGLQAGVPGAVADAISLITPTLQILCGGTPATSDETVLDCETKGAKALSKYTKGVGKCQEKCENDYKDKKGNGGPTDDLDQCSAGSSGDMNFNACVTKATDKAEKKLPIGDLSLVEFQALEGAVADALNTANNDGYNENDCP